MPEIGRAVAVSFLGATVRGTVDSVEADGRALSVMTEEGETIRFVLSGATGTFTAEGHQSGARLTFEDSG